MKPLRDSPAWFAWYHLGLDLYLWQIEALESFGEGVRGGKEPTSLVAANGSGKTQRVIAAAILWFLWRYPRGWCPITSGSWIQVEKQLFPALHSFRGNPLFRKWVFINTEIRTPEGGQAIGFSTDSPGRAEGWHPKVNRDTDPVCYIADEAKSIPDGIFEAISRCTLDFQLIASSPGAPRGKFYRTHHEERSEYHCIKATWKDCPNNIDPQKVEKDRRLYGEDHPVFRSMHLAEFSEDVERMILTPDRLTAALDAQPAKNEKGETVAFCDFAAGGDENVLAIRSGNFVRVAKAWREKDTMQAAREFVKQFEHHGLRQSQIWGDADGLGTVMIDALAELDWRINRFHGGLPALDTVNYANLIAEVWHVGAREIERGRVHLGTISPTLFRQMTCRKSEWNENGKLRNESKEKMRANGLPSPDHADAVFGAIVCGSRMTGVMTSETAANSHIPRMEFSSGATGGW